MSVVITNVGQISQIALGITHVSHVYDHNLKIIGFVLHLVVA
jgi:hypothetical protein